MLFGVHAVAGHFKHGAGVQWDIWSRPGILCWRQVVCVDFTRGFKYRHLNALRHGIVGCKPLGIGPALHDSLGLIVAGIGFFCHIVEGVKYQEGAFQLLCRLGCQFGIVQQGNQCSYVVATMHIAQQCDGGAAINQGRAGFAIDNSA